MNGRAPTIIGFLLAGTTILALGWFVDDRQEEQQPGPATFEILAPATGDTLENPVAVRFRTEAPLNLGRQGWAAGPLHPHAVVDGAELMAGPNDIFADGVSYVWLLPRLRPGNHALLLTWAGIRHDYLATPGDTVRFHVRR